MSREGRVLQGGEKIAFQKSPLVQARLPGQQFRDLLRKHSIAQPQLLEPCGALLDREVQDLIEVRTENAPTVGVDLGHSNSATRGG